MSETENDIMILILFICNILDGILFDYQSLRSIIQISKDLKKQNGGKIMKLTEKTMNIVKQESQNAINQLAEGKNAIEIAGGIYCEALPNKDVETGKVMAKRIDSVILDYENNVRSAFEDSDAWVKSQIDKLIEGKELEERCKTLFSMLVGVSSLNDILTGDKSIEEIQQEYSFDVNNVSEEYENILKEHLIAAVKVSAYGEFQLKELEKALNSGNGDVSIGDIINYGKHEHDVKVIMAMIAYVNAKNGSMEELPADISLDEIAVAVASSYDVAATAEQVGKGKISAEEGVKIIKIISTVASFMIATVLTAAALFSVGFLIGIFLPSIIGIPLIIIAGFTFWELFNETAKKCNEVIIKFGAKVVEDGYALIKKGAKKLIDFISKNIAPKVREIWKKVQTYLRKLKEENAEVTQEETAAVQA